MTTPKTPDGMMQDGADLKDAVEAAFGAGAFEMIADLDDPGAIDGLLSADEQTVQLCGPDQAASGPSARSKRQALFLFEVHSTRFGVPLANVVEIQREPAVTRYRRGPEWFLGLANLRGEVISVVDLRPMLGRAGAHESQGPQRLLVVRSLVDETTTGVLVDAAFGIRGVLADDLQEADGTRRGTDPYIRELVECDGRMVAILNVEQVLCCGDVRNQPM